MVRLTADLIDRSPRFFIADRGLDLRGNQIAAIENLDATEDQFDTIDLSNNDIHSLENFPYLDRLGTLYISNNRIAHINPTIGEHLPQLQTLILTNNRLVNLVEIDPLASLPKLRVLSLMENEVTNKPKYRLYVVQKLMSLQILDLNEVTYKERIEAENLVAPKVKHELRRQPVKTITLGEPSNVQEVHREEQTSKAVAPMPEKIIVKEPHHQYEFGTTTCGLIYGNPPEGVIMGVDSQITEFFSGEVVSIVYRNKLVRLSDNLSHQIYMCRAGVAQTSKEIAELCKIYIDVNRDVDMTVELVAKYASGVSKLKQTENGGACDLIVGGYDKDGPQLFHIPFGKDHKRTDFLVLGSGSRKLAEIPDSILGGSLDNLYSRGSIEEGILTALNIIDMSKMVDLATSGRVHILCVNGHGADRYAFPPMDWFNPQAPRVPEMDNNDPWVVEARDC